MVAEADGQVDMNLSISKTKRERFGGKYCLFIFLLAAALAFIPVTAGAQAAASKEYQIKSAFLFNFAQFVEWPANTFTNAEAPFCIGILGEDSFGRALDETIQGETIQNHKLLIQRSQRLEDLQACQLVFISKSEKGRVAEVLSKLGDRRILTVSELPGFASRGGMINFYLEGKKVRFEINPAAAQREGLKISSQLLSLGKIIEPEPPKGGR
ncbi:MAG: YfiR family protein [Pedosphaera sp.]|nr:YfiR family protein [Pedosphaera sp.]